MVEKQSFPGDLLIGYDTMRDEDISIIPARDGVKLSYKFLPFIDTGRHNITAPVSHPITKTEDNTVSSLNNVAERYLVKSSPTSSKSDSVSKPTVQQINIKQQDEIIPTPTYPQPKAPAETLEIVLVL